MESMLSAKSDIKPVLLSPEMVGILWSCSTKTIYELINSGRLPYVVIPTDGRRKGVMIPTEKKRKRLIRIRAEVAQTFIKEHELNSNETKLPAPKRRRRSVLGLPKGVSSLKRFENNSGSQDEDTKNA